MSEHDWCYCCQGRDKRLTGSGNVNARQEAGIYIPTRLFCQKRHRPSNHKPCTNHTKKAVASFLPKIIQRGLGNGRLPRQSARQHDRGVFFLQPRWYSTTLFLALVSNTHRDVFFIGQPVVARSVLITKTHAHTIQLPPPHPHPSGTPGVPLPRTPAVASSLAAAAATAADADAGSVSSMDWDPSPTSKQIAMPPSSSSIGGGAGRGGSGVSRSGGGQRGGGGGGVLSRRASGSIFADRVGITRIPDRAWTIALDYLELGEVGGMAGVESWWRYFAPAPRVYVRTVYLVGAFLNPGRWLAQEAPI